MGTTADWDPGPGEREWFSHAVNGDRGWKVFRGGKPFIHMDRPQQKMERPFREGEWTPDLERRPLTRFAITNTAFEADRTLCRHLGLHDKANKDWLSLTTEQRIEWMERGPKMPDVRAELYAAIMDVLRPLAK